MNNDNTLSIVEKLQEKGQSSDVFVKLVKELLEIVQLSQNGTLKIDEDEPINVESVK
jgi:hypothetical protein